MTVMFWDHLKHLEISDELDAVRNGSNRDDKSMKLNRNKKHLKNEASESSAECPLK